MRSILIISAIGLLALLTHPASAGPMTNPAGSDAPNSLINQNAALVNSAIVQEAAYRGGRKYRRHRGYNKRRHARRNYRYHKRRYSRRSYRPYYNHGFSLNIIPYFAPAPLYAVPVPVYPGGACAYWSQRCQENWSRRSDYLGCMRYQGCY